jgi:hypothetical protein
VTVTGVVASRAPLKETYWVGREAFRCSLNHFDGDRHRKGHYVRAPAMCSGADFFFFFFTRLGVVGVFHSVSELSRQQADPSSSRQTCRKLTSDKRDFRLLIAYRAALDHYVIIVICLSSLGSVCVVWLVVCLGVILITGCVVGAINIPIATPSCAVSRDASGCMDVWSWSSTHFF